MEMILQNPYYLVSAVAGIAALGFMIAAIVFLLKDRSGKRSEETGDREKKKKSFFKSKKVVSDSDTGREAEHYMEEVTDREVIQKEEKSNGPDAEEYQKKIIQAYQQSSSLRDMLEHLMEGGDECPFGKNIQKAYHYLNDSRYRDFETTLEYLLEPVDAEKLKEDLLQMEIVKHRRIEMRI